MNTGELLVDVIKTGTVALIGTKVTKAIGQKEISEIINGTGWLICGVDIILIISPVCKWIMDFTHTLGDSAKALTDFVTVVGKVFHLGS